jgi:hypothetical protein
VRIGEDARLRNASTVNGGLTVGENVTTAELETVNGSISVGAGSEVAGEIGAVNGRISLEKGAVAAANIGNVNGSIVLEGSEVGGNVKTVNGSINLRDAATVRGDIVIEKPSSWWSSEKSSKMPEVVIGPGSVVVGKIILEREVRLYISETAEVGGVEGIMTMDDAVRFSGDRP